MANAVTPLKERAIQLAQEQFENMDLTEYSWQEIASDVADLLEYFAKQELEAYRDEIRSHI